MQSRLLISSLYQPVQAVRAVETLNGTDLGGRKILVREDREDKDVKNYNRCAREPPETPRLATICFSSRHIINVVQAVCKASLMRLLTRRC